MSATLAEVLRTFGPAYLREHGLSTPQARAWLGLPTYQRGSSADLVVYAEDPGDAPEVLRHPVAVVRHGRVVRGASGVD